MLLLCLCLTACANRKTYGEPYDPLAAYDTREQAGAASARPAPVVASAGADVGEKPVRRPVEGVFSGSGAVLNTARAEGTVVSDAAGEVTLNFGPTEIREIVDAVLGQTLGLSYTLDDRVRGTIQLRTSHPIPRSAVLPMLEQALNASGAALIETDGGYRIVPAEVAQRSIPRARVGAAVGAGLAVQVIPLRFGSASALAETLKPFVPKQAALQVDAARNVLIALGTSEDVRNLADITAMFDVDYLAGMTFALFRLDYADPKTMVAELQTVFGDPKTGPTAGAVRFVALERLNSVMVVTAQPRYIDHARAWIGRLDRQGEGEGRQVYVYRVQNRKASELAAILDGIFGSGRTTVGAQPSYAPGETPARIGMSSFAGSSANRTAEGGQTQTAESSATRPVEGSRAAGARGRTGATTVDTGAPAETVTVRGEGTVQTESNIRVIADESHNALTVLATAQDYRKVEQALKRLDVVPLQVLIEATIAEVTLNDKLQYGLEWFIKSGKFSFTLSNLATGAVSSSFPGFSAVASGFGGDVHVVLSALDQITKVRVLSSPQMMVLNNHSAVLQVGDQVPILTRSAVSVTDPAAPVVNSIEYHDTGVILRVTPRVNESGLVTMDIRQEVSDVVPTSTSTIDSPTIQQRYLDSSVAIDSGETIAMGGLIQDRKTNDNTGIPLLSEIPLLGHLFKTTTDQLQRTELLVLITPRIVRDADQARSVTQELRDHLTALNPKQLSPSVTPTNQTRQ